MPRPAAPRRSRLPFAAAAACAIGTVLLASPVTVAQEGEAAAQGDVSVGLAGFVRPGDFTPVRFGPRWAEADVVACTTTDADGLRVLRPLRSGGGEAVTQAGRVDSPVRLEAGAIRTVLRPGADFGVLGPGERLWVAVGFGADGPGEADLTDDPAVRVGTLADLAAMPADAAGWEAAHVVFLAGGAVGGDAADGNEPRLAALLDWVRAGGHLVFSADADAGPDATGRLRRVGGDGFPLTVLGRGPFERYGAVESLAGRGDGGRAASAINRLIPVNATWFAEPPAADVLANGAGGPLIVEAAHGAGRVTLVGVPLHRPPLAGWRGLAPLVKRLVRRAPGLLPSETARVAGERRRELATQAFAAAETRGGGVSLAAVSVLVLLFLAAVGPLDWYLTHRLLGRPRLTWLTLPVILLAAGGLAAAAGGLDFTGFDRGGADDAVRLDRLEIVTFDTPTATAAGEAWVTAAAARTGRVSLGVAPSDLFPGRTEGLRLGWAADPEERYGGLYRGGGRGIVTTGYAITSDTPPLAGAVPLPRRAAKRFRAAWRSAGVTVIAANSLRESRGRLRGTVSHTLPGDLEDALLVHAGQAYRRETGGSVGPNEPWGPASPGVRRRALGGLLTQVNTAEEEDDLGTTYRRVRGSYDARSRDAAAVLRMLSLHDRAGGSGYTGLRNTALQRLDLSPLVGLNRALLIGRLRTPLTTVTADAGTPPAGESAGGSVTWVRVILPVEPDAGEEPAGRVGADRPLDFRAPLPPPASR